MKKALIIGCAAIGAAALGYFGLLAYTVHALSNIDFKSEEINDG
jgi:hypothetical protein